MLPTVENVLFLHTVSIEAFGGSEGVRDLVSLRAAVARPRGSSFEKAASLAESLIRRHQFIDGNKRTAMYSAAYLLETLGYRLETGQQDLEDFAVSLALGGMDTIDIAHWFESYSHKT
jgi:death-on-curing protein